MTHRFASAVGSETVREKSGWQGKLSTKGHKCNEARIATSAFYLKRKALLPGKWRHDTEIMITCDQVINLEFECISVGDFIIDEILSIRRKAK